MKKINLIKVSILALFAMVVLAAFSFSIKEEEKAEPPKCCMKQCTPEQKGSNTEHIFYETFNGHLLSTFLK